MSRSPRFARAVLLAGALFVPGTIARAQGTALVPLTDPAYRDLDRVAELVPVPAVLVTQRPFSAREMCRVAGAAREKLADVDSATRAVAGALLASLVRHCAPGAVISEVDAVVTNTDAARRPLVGTFGTPTEATIGSIGERRIGAPLRSGVTASLAVSQRLEPLPWLAVAAQERVDNRGGESGLLRASVRARAGNLALLVGREPVAWSQRAADGGLLLAADAPALDQVSISSDQPFRLPWVLRGAGPARGTLLLADLGPSVSHSHSRLLAYKLSVQPAAGVEMGGSFLNHFGGTGARSSGVVDRLIDFLPFVDLFRRHNYTDPSQALDVESDKVFGLDARVRLQRLGGVTLAGEWLIDDFDVHKLPTLLSYLGSHRLSIVVPRLVSPAASLALTATHMGRLTYTHATLTNGLTTRGRLLGDELGPDAKAFGATVTLAPSARWRAEAEARHAIYSNAQYVASFADSAQTDYVFRVVSRTPDEVRDRLLAGVVLRPDARTELRARGALQRVRNAGFGGGSRMEHLLEVGITLRP